VSTRRFLVTAFLLYLSLTCLMTYPQVLHLRDGVHDDGDPLLNAWTLAWVAHQLPRAPARLFDANIFYPERRTLAFSETLLLPALVMAPLRWLGVGPLLVYNVVLLSGFVLSGVGVALLVRTLTGWIGPALVAGIVFAFLPFRIDHYAHMQLQQTQCLPFALWAFHRLLARGRVRDGAVFGAFSAGQLLSCVYYGLLMIPYLAVVCATLLLGHARGAAQRTRDGRVALAIVVAIAIVLVAAVPVGMAYVGARKVVGERGRDEVVNGSATLLDYLGPPPENALYGKALGHFAEQERRLFPGFVAVALAGVGLWSRSGSRRTDRSGRTDGSGRTETSGIANGRATDAVAKIAYALGLLIAFDISLGYHGLTYPLLYEYFVPLRAGIIVGLSLAVLAGYGVAHMAAMVRSPAARRIVLAAIGALIVAEYASRPIRMIAMPLAPPAAYGDVVRDRGDSPTATLFEFPLSSKDDPTYMYFSTFHWQHLVNGYSGFFPPAYVFLANAVDSIPDNASIHAIKSHGARYLLLHGERLILPRYNELVAQLDARPELTVLSRTPVVRNGERSEISVYRISYVENR